MSLCNKDYFYIEADFFTDNEYLLKTLYQTSLLLLECLMKLSKHMKHK